ncbi:MAG: carbamoyltransferase [Alcanivoracaceae bacterium]|nr:carbamoyltransferase [Alcanivoracaceae bacterium]
MKILGISAFYHDSAAAIIDHGEVVAAAQEERFSRKKQDPRFPHNAITWCLAEAGIELADLDAIVFYDKPLMKFQRLVKTYLSHAPSGLQSFMAAMPVWLKDKIHFKRMLRENLALVGNCEPGQIRNLKFAGHHESHAASAFFPSPFERAAVICIDGVGEWATTSIWRGEGARLTPEYEIDFPHSLGLLYAAFTAYTGFKVNSGEYKLMGLAPYGEPRYVDLIKEHLIDIREDGSFRLDMSYFGYTTGLTMTSEKFDALFGGPPRTAESEITQREMDLAASIQVVTEEVVLKLAAHARKTLGLENVCLAGGVALNCVSNGRLLREGIFSDMWIQPAAGDAGGAIGAALAYWHTALGKPRNMDSTRMDAMQGSYLGPRFSNDDICQRLDALDAVYEKVDDSELMSRLAHILEKENVVGWFQGRMEFGPRALGGRSIIGDPRSKAMQSVMNLKIKYRESFRPFAPAILAEHVSEWFEHDNISPYMLIVAPVKESIRRQAGPETEGLFGIDKLKVPRSSIPAVTHVDYSARIQTVHEQTNPRFHQLLNAFNQLTGCPILVNTSFNVRGEPIVCTPEDAYRCFMRTEMDYLVLENIILEKKKQPEPEDDDDWREEFELD